MRSVRHTTFTVLGVVLCIALVPILAVNIALLAMSFVDSDKVPSIGGYFPLIVLTDSMYPGIQSGDLIICHTATAQEVQVGDVISFFDPAGNGTSVVSHRVIEINDAAGELSFTTQGDANNAADAAAVPAENLVGIYMTRIAGAGNVAMFMQSTPGLVVCVVIPLVLLVGYDVVRRRLYERKKAQDTEALMQELEALRECQRTGRG